MLPGEYECRDGICSVARHSANDLADWQQDGPGVSHASIQRCRIASSLEFNDLLAWIEHHHLTIL